jgi:DNA polymerase-3 subunit delta'
MKSAAASAEESRGSSAALVRAAREGRLPHSILLHGGDIASLRRAAMETAALQLAVRDAAGHIDLRELRPSGKMRFIRIDHTLEVVRFANMSSHSGRKAVVVHEADRMNEESANAFLKTLEEPPAGTGIILYTQHPYRILPTILSRCMRFGIAGAPTGITEPTWRDWSSDFSRLLTSVVSPARPTLAVVSAYGLLARFESVHKQLVERALAADPMPDFADIEDPDEREDLQAAHTSRIERTVRSEMLAEMQDALRRFAREAPVRARAVTDALAALEEASHRAHRLNVQPLLAVEAAMLVLLRALARSAQT